MLVVSRRAGEVVKIGDDITVTVVEIRGGKVRLAIAAPQATRIRRGELPPRTDNEESERDGIED